MPAVPKWIKWIKQLDQQIKQTLVPNLPQECLPLYYVILISKTLFWSGWCLLLWGIFLSSLFYQCFGLSWILTGTIQYVLTTLSWTQVKQSYKSSRIKS